MSRVKLPKIVSQTPCMCVKWHGEEEEEEAAFRQSVVALKEDANDYALTAVPGFYMCGKLWGGIGATHERQPSKKQQAAESSSSGAPAHARL